MDRRGRGNHQAIPQNHESFETNLTGTAALLQSAVGRHPSQVPCTASQGVPGGITPYSAAAPTALRGMRIMNSSSQAGTVAMISSR
jgi:hypothetical protein